MFKILTATACAIATTAAADPMAGLQNHYIQQAYILEPCGTVIAMIDEEGSDPDAFSNGIMAIMAGAMADLPPEEILKNAEPMMQQLTEIANVAMAFGFLMDFEATHPNINGTHETVLMRLRADCAAEPSKTAMEYLLIYADG